MTNTDHVRQPAQEGHDAGGHRGHGWMMIACCSSMVAIAVVLFATGVASVGFLVVALMCTAMMAMMMRRMSQGDQDRTPTNHEARR